MSGSADLRALVPQAYGWWGKLPSRGDFVGRGLPRTSQRAWDDWLQRALAAAAQRLGADALRERLQAMAPWHGVVLPGPRGTTAWNLVVAPSRDRVGRVFPLVLAESYDAGLLEASGLLALRGRAWRLADWLDRVGTLATPKDFESGAAQLVASSWDGTPQRGDTRLAEVREANPAARSFWWCPEPIGPLRPPLVQPWLPQESLLLDWLDG